MATKKTVTKEPEVSVKGAVSAALNKKISESLNKFKKTKNLNRGIGFKPLDRIS